MGNVGGDPVEVFAYTNTTGSNLTVNVLIGIFSGANPGFMKYVIFGSSAINEFATNSGTIYGHANAAGAEATGAADYVKTPAFGVDPPELESFSSAGPTPILFDVSGVRLGTAEVRAKPEIVAPDGTNTTFFGSSDASGGGCCEQDGFPNFFGTSAAAPHAAALAAMMIDAEPLITPSQIYSKMESTAIDMGVPGPDDDSGFGLVQGEQAVDGLIGLDLNVGVLTTLSMESKPGQPIAPEPVQLTNSGGVDGHLAIRIYNVTESGGIFSEAECTSQGGGYAPGSPPACTGLVTPDQNDLGRFFELGVEESSTELLASVPLGAVEDLCVELGGLGSGETRDLLLLFRIDEAADNRYQGDMVHFDIDLLLHQPNDPAEHSSTPGEACGGGALSLNNLGTLPPLP